MKRGCLNIAAVLLLAQVAMLPRAYAGFDIDPGVQVALDSSSGHANAAITHSAPASSSSSSMATTMTPPVTVGAAVSAGSVSSTTIVASNPSAAWDTKVQGFARNEPIRQALTHVVPAAGHLTVNGALPDKRVSWDGSASSSRIVVARKMLSDAGLDGQFDGDNLIVTALTATATRGVTAGPAAAVAADPATVPRHWTIPKGVMLSDGLADWIEQTGAYGEQYKWGMDWKAYDQITGDKVDYPVPAPLHFYGTIDEVAAKLIFLYHASKIPLRIDISKQQRFIHISVRGAN